MVRVVVAIVISRTVTPSPKLQDLKKKVSYWMDESQSLTKLQTPIYEVKDYYNGDSSLPLPIEAF